jgi:hypothetical protein
MRSWCSCCETAEGHVVAQSYPYGLNTKQKKKKGKKKDMSITVPDPEANQVYCVAQQSLGITIRRAIYLYIPAASPQYPTIAPKSLINGQLG